MFSYICGLLPLLHKTLFCMYKGKKMRRNATKGFRPRLCVTARFMLVQR